MSSINIFIISCLSFVFRKVHFNEQNQFIKNLLNKKISLKYGVDVFLVVSNIKCLKQIIVFIFLFSLIRVKNIPFFPILTYSSSGQKGSTLFLIEQIFVHHHKDMYEILIQ
jgi:hypothetical protein